MALRKLRARSNSKSYGNGNNNNNYSAQLQRLGSATAAQMCTNTHTDRQSALAWLFAAVLAHSALCTLPAADRMARPIKRTCTCPEPGARNKD